MTDGTWKTDWAYLLDESPRCCLHFPCCANYFMGVIFAISLMLNHRTLDPKIKFLIFHCFSNIFQCFPIISLVFPIFQCFGDYGMKLVWQPEALTQKVKVLRFLCFSNISNLFPIFPIVSLVFQFSNMLETMT